jgi:hypothetical protein
MSEKNQNMKTLVKAVLTMVGVVLATTAARADLYEDIFVTVGTGAGSEIQVDSSVSGPLAGEYTYTYALTQVFMDGGIDAFSVYSLGAPFTGLSITGITSPVNFNGGVNGGHVSWSVNLNPVVDQNLPLSFSYESPYAPTYGYTGATDGGTYQPLAPLTVSNEVWVPILPPPPVPDGGLTFTLMSGALLGLGALRRKIGC